MKISLCFAFASLVAVSSAAVQPHNNHSIDLEKRRALIANKAAKAPAPAAKKPTVKKVPKKKPATKNPVKKPTKAPAPAPRPAPAPKPAKHVPAPVPVPVTPAPAAPQVPKTNFSGALSKVQQLQLAAITEYAQQTLTTVGGDMFSDADFVKAGYSQKVRFRILNFLNSNANYIPKYKAALGAQMPGNCTYKFPIGSPQDLVALSKIVEQAAHNARFQPEVTPVLVTEPYANVPRTQYQIKSGYLSNTIAQYIVSCPTPLDGGIVLQAPPLLTLPAGAKPAVGQSLALTLPSTVKLDMNHAFVHLVSGSQHIVQNVTLSGSTVTVTIPPQPKAAAKGLTFVSIINNADTGTYSGPSDTNLWTASVPINANGSVCKLPFVC